MSWLEPRGKKGTLHYRTENGYSRTTKTNNPTIAKMLQAKWDAKLLRSENGLVDMDMTWAEFRDEHYEIVVKVLAESTFERLCLVVRDFERIVMPGKGEPDRKKLMAITQTDCERWQATRLGEIAPVSVDAEQKFLAPVFKKAHERGYIERNPFADIRRPRFMAKDARAFSVDEAGLFLQALHKKYPHHDLLGQFYYETGMRLMEGLHQRMEDIDFARRLIKANPHDHFCVCFQCAKQKKAGWTGKAGIPRNVPMSPSLAAGLLQLFQERKTGCVFPLAENTVMGIFRKVLIAAGIYKTRTNSHTFRHTLATDMERAGVRRGVIKVIVGHAKSTTTDTYIHADPAELHEALEKLLVWREEQRTKIKKTTDGGFGIIEASA